MLTRCEPALDERERVLAVEVADGQRRAFARVEHRGELWDNTLVPADAAARLEPLQINGDTEEVRLAMAWNGGVSLAVWMGGVAVELDAARRAHLGTGGSDDGRSIYRALCLAFNRILVLDILTGASAGGINGALLGGMITHRRRLDANYLRNRWIALGSFSDLLRPTNMKKPPSLMDGDYFTKEVSSTFRDCLGESSEAAVGELELAPDAHLPDEVLLDVQSTNVSGLQRAIPDHWGEYFYAREYRAPIRFRRAEDYTVDALATAARASASFPAAFEPAKIDGDAAKLAGYEGRIRWGIDGGLLENAPIEAAIDLIPKRRADRKVRRFVVYVNADPPGKAAVEDHPPSPDLQQVLGYVVNLPRDARFIDELVAIENAFRRGQTAADATLPLAQLPHEALGDTANALLDANRRRRALGSLEEVTAQPGQPPRPGLGRAIFSRLVDADQLSLPWLPPAASVQVSLDDWRWGIRAAQRVLFLELDLLRLAGSPDILLANRGPIDGAIAELDSLATVLHGRASIREATAELIDVEDDDLAAHLEALDGLFAAFRPEIRNALETGTNAFLEAIAPLPMSTSLLDGMEHTDMDRVTFFVWRALAIEVIRRAFVADHEVDSAQTLRFAQLSPVAPCPVMTAKPFHDRGPDSPGDKLTGIHLGHFSAFYRASWRANDFMWGRLDGALRVVDLMVDAGTAANVGVLAEALVPQDHDEDAADRRALVVEALADAGTPNIPDDPAQLRTLVDSLITADLGNSEKTLTRILCARAAQYETLKDELPALVKQAEVDSKLGCFTPPIRLEAGSTLQQIKQLRLSADSPKSVAERLGRDSPDEATSTLALRTLSQAALVGVATLNSLRLPLGKATVPVRVPFLSVSGLTSQAWGKRLAAGVAYAAAAAYLTTRWLGIQSEETRLEAVTSLATIVLWIAALAVLGLVAVPSWRAWRAKQGTRKLGQGAWAIALLVAGGLIAASYAWWEFGTWETLTASTGPTPPEWMLWLVLATLGPAAYLVRRLPSVGPARVLFGRTINRLDTGGALTAFAVFVASAVLCGWSVVTLLGDARDDDGGIWQWVGVVLVALATLLGIAYALFHRWRRR
jgi:predicted acylesterase/phospholipase RssA